MTAAITAFGFVDETGIGGGARAIVPFDGPDAIRWADVSARPFDRFARLDPLCRVGMCALEMLDIPPCEESQLRAWAIVLGTDTGSLAVDVAFLNTAGDPYAPSPSLFSYTLASALLGEASIRHRITGPNICLAAGPDSALAALWEAASLIDDGSADACIVLAAEAPAPPLGEGPSAFAYAFLLKRAARETTLDKLPVAFAHFEETSATPCDISVLVSALKGRLSLPLHLRRPSTACAAQSLVIRFPEG